MAKGIIVIDIPESCMSCPCYKETYTGWDDNWDDGGEWCGITGEAVYGYTDDEQCPIKPMPEKYSKALIIKGDTFNERYVDGWNACIDEILGE